MRFVFGAAENLITFNTVHSCSIFFASNQLSRNNRKALKVTFVLVFTKRELHNLLLFYQNFHEDPVLLGSELFFVAWSTEKPGASHWLALLLALLSGLPKLEAEPPKKLPPPESSGEELGWELGSNRPVFAR